MLSKKFAFIAPAFLACTFASAALAIEPPANGGQDPAQGAGGKDGGKDGGKGGERKRPDFKTLDKNGDGFITEDEVPAQAWERMKKFDANGDGKISADEMTKGMAEQRGRGKGNGGKDGSKEGGKEGGKDGGKDGGKGNGMPPAPPAPPAPPQA